MVISCLVNPAFGGGIGRHTREMVAGLAGRSGVECRLLAAEADLRRHPDFLASLPPLAVQRLPLAVVTMDRIWKLAGWPPVDRWVRGSDILYCPAHARPPARSIPTVMTVHDVQAFETDLPWSGTTEHRLFRRKWAAWLPRAARECARMLTVSQFSKRRLVELAEIDPAKIGVVGNGVSRCFFEAESAGGVGAEPAVVVVGGLRTMKGAGDTLAVARELYEIGSPLIIRVVGQNDLEWEARARAQRNVRLEGVLPDARLAGLLAGSVGLLFLSPYEGFGIPAVEAMAAGTPAVVADRAALPEVVGDAGVVVEPSRHRHVAGILERLRQDKEFRAHVVERGRDRARKFTWERCISRLVDELTSAREDWREGGQAR